MQVAKNFNKYNFLNPEKIGILRIKGDEILAFWNQQII